MRFFYALTCVFAALLLSRPAFSLPAEGEWEQIPGTTFRHAEPTQAEVGYEYCDRTKSCPGKDFGAWTSFAWDGDTMYSICNGGHADEGGCDGYRVSITSALQGPPAGLTHWERFLPIRPLTRLTGQVDENGNPVCNWPEWGGPAQHTYGGFIHLRDSLFFHIGNLGFCGGRVMQPGKFAWIIDTSTTPETWTSVPGLDSSGGEMASAYFDGYLWTVTKAGTTKKTDIDTQTVLYSAASRKVRFNGVDLAPGSTGYGSQMSSGTVNSQGLLCWNTAGYITCTNLRGAVRDIDGNGVLDNDSPGRMRSFAVGANAPAGSVASQIAWGKNGWVALPDDCFAIWRGTSRVYRFCPAADFMVSGAATVEEWNPLVGALPTGSSTNVYQKMFPMCRAGQLYLIAAVSPTQDLWAYNPPGYECEGGEPEPEPQAGGPSSAEFATLAALPGVIHAQNFAVAPPRTQGLAARWGSTASDPRAVDPVFEDGVMKLTMPAGCESSCSGWYQGRFATVGPGETLTVQFDMKLDAGYFQTFVKQGGGVTHPKLFIISSPGSDDCTTNQAVMVENSWTMPDGSLAKTPRFYLTCTPTNHQSIGSIQVGGSRLFDTQPIMTPEQMDRVWAGESVEDVARPSMNRMCVSGHVENCVQHVARWVKVRYSIQMGDAAYIDSQDRPRWRARVTGQMWIDGTWHTFVDMVDAGIKGLDLGYGKIKLMFFPPNLDETLARALPAEVWFDNLIVSTEPLPD